METRCSSAGCPPTSKFPPEHSALVQDVPRTVCPKVVVAGSPAKGSLLGFFCQGILSRWHTSRFVIDRLPYWSPLCLTLQTDLFFSLLSRALPSTTSDGGAFCTRVKCPGGHCVLVQAVQGDILPSDTSPHFSTNMGIHL